MELTRVIERLKRAFQAVPPYERPADLEHAHRVLDDQQTEIGRLREIAELERWIRDIPRD